MCPLNLHSAVYGDSIKLKIVALLDMYIWLSAFQKIWTTCKSPLKVLLGGNSTLKLYTEWKYTNLHKYLRIKQKLPKSFVVPSCVRNSCNTYCPCDTWSLYQVIMEWPPTFFWKCQRYFIRKKKSGVYILNFLRDPVVEPGLFVLRNKHYNFNWIYLLKQRFPQLAFKIFLSWF